MISLCGNRTHDKSLIIDSDWPVGDACAFTNDCRTRANCLMWEKAKEPEMVLDKETEHLSISG